MDITPQIIRINEIYGASDNTQPQTLSASRSLNYASGASIHSPAVENLKVIPFKFRYEDAVGLFGAENHFVRINVEIDSSVALRCFEERGWECAQINETYIDEDAFYKSAEIDLLKDLTIVNTYDPADVINGGLPNTFDPYISVVLNNLKTGNQYYDNWLSVCLYTREREPIAGDRLFVKLNDYFYIGFSARDTRRLPYNVELTVGEELRSGLPAWYTRDYVNYC
tara:strand:+ start:180 stop:854 length:675 start_codon:yes stop_codon:yes gene_type:complete